MSFNVDKFLSAKFKRIEKSIDVPDLKDFFEEGEKPVWIVRGLTGIELGKMAEAVKANKTKADIVEGLMSGETRKLIDSMKSMIGADSNAPDDIAKRLSQITLGSVNPVCNQQLAVRLCEFYPIEFYQITNEITLLTGRGYELGKHKHSTETIESN